MAGVADTSKFIIPEENYGGLYKIGEDLDRNRRFEYEQQQRELSRRRATFQFINNSLDPKDYFTGTFYDPVISGMINEAKKQAYDLSSKGAGADEIQMAIMPVVDKLNGYYMTSKSINKQIDEQLQGIPANSGYLKDKLRQRALQTAFVDDKGQLKDPREIDPKTDFLSIAAQKYPMDVTDLSGLTNYLNQIPRVPSVVSSKTYNNKGGFTMKKLKVTAPDWMQLDTDQRGNNTRELVPKFQLATEDENPIVGTDGQQVRLVDEGIFNNILSKNHSYADRLRGEVQQAIESGQLSNPNGSKIDINSPQATNAARALMYHDLKDLTPRGVEDIVEEKPTQIHVSVNGGKGASASDINIRDIYNEIKEKTDSHKGSVTPLVDLTNSAQSLALKQARDLTKDNTIDQTDIYIRKHPDGKYYIHKVTKDGRVSNDDPVLGEMDFTGTNFTVQPNVKSKTEVVNEGNKKSKQKGKYDNL